MDIVTNTISLMIKISKFSLWEYILSLKHDYKTIDGYYKKAHTTKTIIELCPIHH